MSATNGKDSLAIAFVAAVALSLSVPVAWADAAKKAHSPVHSPVRGPVPKKSLPAASKISQVKLQSQEATTDLPLVAPDRTASGDLSHSVAPLTGAAGASTRQLLQQGATQFRKGNTDEAEASFRQVLVNDHNNVDALFNLGSLSERRGDLVSARGFYSKALNLKKKDAELKQAVASVEDQIQADRSSGSKAALHGSAIANDLESMPESMPPLAPQLAKRVTAPLLGVVQANNTGRIQLGNPQQAQFGQQPFSVPVYANRVPQSSVSQLPVPMLSVHQAPISQASVTQWKQAIPLVHVGMGLVPGMRGMSCPVCGLLNKL